MSAAVTQLTPKKLAKFLKVLASCGNVSQSAQAAGMSRESAYKVKNTDPAFAEAWDDALEQAADTLEQEAWRRAHDGVEEPVYQGGEQVGTITKYSDTLLIFLLKGTRPHKFRENVQVSGSLGLTGIQQLLETMRGDGSSTDAANDTLSGISTLGATR